MFNRPPSKAFLESSPLDNRLLAAVPDGAYVRLLPDLERVELPLGSVLYEPESLLRHVYFPTTCIVSLLYVMKDGASAEIAVVGNDGMVGTSLFLGGGTTPSRAVVQNAGTVYRIKLVPFLAEVQRHDGLERLLLRYTQALLTQMVQTAACNRHHAIDQQFCRWLLLSLDRLPTNELTMTEELIAKMLGSPVAVVVGLADALQVLGLLTHKGGQIRVTDRPGLEFRSCECYRVVKTERIACCRQETFRWPSHSGARSSQQMPIEAVAGSIHQDLWQTSLHGCFLLHSERNAEGDITDFVFDQVNANGASLLGLAKDAIVGRRLREVVAISRDSPLFQRYLHVAATSEPLDEEYEVNLAEIAARWIDQQVVATPNGIGIVARDISARKLRELENDQNAGFLQTLIDSVPLLICATSIRAENFNEVVLWNQGAERITGYTEEEISHFRVEAVMPDIDFAMSKIAAAGEGVVPEIPHRFVRRDGSKRQLRTRSVPVLDRYGKPEYLLGIAEDITEHVAALEQVRLATIVFEHATEAIVVSDAHDRIVSVNAAFCNLTGYSAAEVAGREAADFETTGLEVLDRTKMLECVERAGFWSGRGGQLRKDRPPFPTWRNVARVTNDEAHTVNFVRIATDITAMEAAREQLEDQANHDALTGLPNRRLFMDRLTHALARCTRSKEKLALLFIDLDNFKAVNDRLGHLGGDDLLKEVAIRLSCSARSVDTVCRLSGDEFTIIMENSGHLELEVADRCAGRIIAALRKPFTLDNNTVVVATASIGISLYPSDGTDANSLLRNADIALYRAKELGRNRCQYFSTILDGKPPARTDIEAELAIAIDQQQLFLVYEPMIDLATGATVGFEALVRWNHPTAGSLRPDAFIYIAEATGLIVRLGEWVLRRACADLQRWRQQGLPDFPVSVNISAGQFQRGNLLDVVERSLRDHDLRPNSIELELTESLLLDSLQATRDIVIGLKALGVSIAIDDFGTGYSSLLLLRRIAPNRLKIDRAFTQDLQDDPGTVNIVRAILALARTLKMSVVAEGVETPAQLQCLKSLGCSRAQGYFFSRPVLPEDVPALLRQQRMLPAKLTAVAARPPL